MDKARNLVVVGQGYVGLPLAMRAVEVGYDVVGLEIDDDRLKRLGAGESYVEDITDEQLQAALATGRYEPSSEPRSLRGFDISVITVPPHCGKGTPTSPASSRPLGRWRAPCVRERR